MFVRGFSHFNRFVINNYCYCCRELLYYRYHWYSKFHRAPRHLQSQYSSCRYSGSGRAQIIRSLTLVYLRESRRDPPAKMGFRMVYWAFLPSPSLNHFPNLAVLMMILRVLVGRWLFAASLLCYFLYRITVSKLHLRVVHHQEFYFPPHLFRERQREALLGTNSSSHCLIRPGLELVFLVSTLSVSPTTYRYYSMMIILHCYYFKHS